MNYWFFPLNPEIILRQRSILASVSFFDFVRNRKCPFPCFGDNDEMGGSWGFAKEWKYEVNPPWKEKITEQMKIFMRDISISEGFIRRRLVDFEVGKEEFYKRELFEKKFLELRSKMKSVR
ncbi:MAG: hypothetical protein ACQEWD_07475 [Bacteroidota bacterium]